MNDIRFERQDRVAIATFDRPDALNAFRANTFAELRTIFEQTRQDPALRVLILTGTGRAFSAGIDLKELSGGMIIAMDPSQARAQIEALQDLTRQMVEHPLIIISAVNGLAVGVGAELALASDLRIAAETASFAFPEVRRGLFETNGVTYLLPRLVGAGRAAELLLTGRKVLAAEAHTIGLVSTVTTTAAPHDTALELANTIANNAPLAVKQIKQVLRQSWDTNLAGMLALETDAMLTCLQSADLAEGLRAFIEKRTPTFRGI
jgi:enoyl-CoA hydratase/carnithine racemase